MAAVDEHEDSAVRSVLREASILAAAGRAILLQVAHPKVARGVAEHSRFAEDPLKRLQGTMYYVYGTAFGTPEEAAWIAGVVNDVHKRVTGPGYSADDPELQLWVAATLYDSGLQIYEATLGPMSEAMQEELRQEYARFATQLGCPEELWPSSVAEFRQYWRQQVATLEVTEDAKRICHDMMYSRSLPWYLRTLLPLNRLITAGLLPERIRDEYGFAWNSRRKRRFQRVARVLRLAYPRIPRSMRGLPMKLYMRSFRKRYRGYA